MSVSARIPIRRHQKLLCGVFVELIQVRPIAISTGISIFMACGPMHTAAAFQVYSDNGFQITLDTTVEYNPILRVNSPSQTMLNNSNTNDGDGNLKHGLVGNQFSILPVLNITDGSFGVHVSDQAYLDPTYLRQNQNDSPNTVNYFVSNNRNFPGATQNIDGRNNEILDAFVYGSKEFGSNDAQTITVKVGRSTLLWGQSLFFTNNGIAAGQAPININEAVTLANPQAQQVFLPVGQGILTYQPNNWITLQGYYQFQWTQDQFPGVGSYFSGTDFFAPGGERLIFSPAGPVYIAREKDGKPPTENGQFGLSAQLQLGNYDIGFYGLRFDDKGPQFYYQMTQSPGISASGVRVGSYNVVYARDIQIYGASVSTTIGAVNVAGEISTRRNMDLFSNLVVYQPGFNENSNPGYAVGNTLQEQANFIYLTPGLPLMPGGASILGEIEANSVISYTKNKNQLISGRTPNAIGMELLFTPTYYNVLPNLDLDVPVGFTWYPTGRSQIDSTMNAGTGVFNIGLKGVLKQTWIAGVTYQDYLGSTTITSAGTPKQTLADRGYVSLYVIHTF